MNVPMHYVRCLPLNKLTEIEIEKMERPPCHCAVCRDAVTTTGAAVITVRL